MLAKHTIIEIDGDGNCQFRAISKALNNGDTYEDIRSNVIIELQLFQEDYSPFCENSNYNEYVKNMSNDTVWGDHLTLRAISKVYQINVIVYSNGKLMTKIIEKKYKDTVFLDYNNYHYNLIQINKRYHLLESLLHTKELYTNEEWIKLL